MVTHTFKITKVSHHIHSIRPRGRDGRSAARGEGDPAVATSHDRSCVDTALVDAGDRGGQPHRRATRCDNLPTKQWWADMPRSVPRDWTSGCCCTWPVPTPCATARILFIEGAQLYRGFVAAPAVALAPLSMSFKEHAVTDDLERLIVPMAHSQAHRCKLQDRTSSCALLILS